MLKKEIEYTDDNGVSRKETFYFNLSEAELTELQLTYPGGYGSYITKISEAKDQAEIVKLMKDLIRMSYGVKSEDGKRFMKSEEISQAFFETEAYNKLFMELATDDMQAANFVNGILPKALMDKLKENEDDELMERTKQLIESKKNE